MSQTLHRKRALLHGGNTAILSIAAIGILVLGYMTVDRYRPFRKDFTAEGLYSLSPKTVDMLKKLDRDVKVTFFNIPQSASEQAGVINQNVADLLEEYKTRSNGHVTYTISNPLADLEKLEALGADPGSAVFESGDKKIVVEQKDLVKDDFESESADFTGEEAFDSALMRLEEGKAQTACFLGGHGEPPIDGDNATGFAIAKDMLRRENFDSKTVKLAGNGDAAASLDGKLSLDSKPDATAPAASGVKVPDDCTVLVVAGPTAAISGPEGDAIMKFWENGGGVVLLADPLTHSGIEQLAAKFGVQIYDGIAADPQRKMRTPLAILPAYESHEIVSSLAQAQEPLLFMKAVGMKAMDKLPAGVTATPLLQTSAVGLELVDIKNGEANADSPKNVKGPIQLGYALERANSNGKTARAVILGDSDFATNQAMQAMAEASAPGNIELFKNVVDWTAGAREKIGIGPKAPGRHPVTISDQNAWMVLAGTGIFLPGSIFFSGLVIWVRRRHR